MVKWSKVEGLGQKGWFAASALMLALSMIVSTSNVLETFAAPLKAQVPEQIGFEGYLTDPNNATLPLDDGTYSIRFSVFNAATAGTELWAEVQPSVAITDGYFSTTLGSITSFTTTTIFDGDRWIAVRFNGGNWRAVSAHPRPGDALRIPGRERALDRRGRHPRRVRGWSGQ